MFDAVPHALPTDTVVKWLHRYRAFCCVGGLQMPGIEGVSPGLEAQRRNYLGPAF